MVSHGGHGHSFSGGFSPHSPGRSGRPPRPPQARKPGAPPPGYGRVPAKPSSAPAKRGVPVPGWVTAYDLASSWMPDKRVISVLELSIWRVLQTILFAVGVGLVWLLMFKPKLGLLLFWNVVIPVAPFLVTVAPGLWRNICPMATVGLLPRLLGFSMQIMMPAKLAAVLRTLGVLGLFLVVPLRQVLLNVNGQAAALMLLGAAAAAFLMGTVFQWRSGWCTSLCPIHPVEKLYGTSPAAEFKNARCLACQQCSNPCPDSTAGMNPTITGPTVLEAKIGYMLTGGFFGFVWGWFQVANYEGHVGMPEIMNTYAWPLGGALVSLILFRILDLLFGQSPKVRGVLGRMFAAGAVSTYYWYVVPSLFVKFTGMVLPWLPLTSHIVTTSFFIWFLVLRPLSGRCWLTRPKAPPAEFGPGAGPTRARA
jgi:hypothetical protein